MVARAKANAEQEGTEELVDSLIGHSRYRRARQNLNREGVNVDDFPMENKKGQLF